MAICISKRRQIIQYKEAGKSLYSISTDLELSYSTVKRVWQAYQKSGSEGLIPNYKNCGLAQPKYYRIYRMSKMLKRKYPKWGAPYILTILSTRYPTEKMPAVRTIQNWFKEHGFSKPVFQRPVPKETLVKDVHDCWQIDAKENIILKDQTKCCYLTTVDVKSGIALEVPVFPPQKN